MATGVKPREEPQLTRSELEVLEGAMRDETFRKLLGEYCEELRDPENQALYRREVTQLERERGFDVTFLDPQPGYVLKTSVAGDRKALVNICSSEHVGRPSCRRESDTSGRAGLAWSLPYSLLPPREEWDRARRRCLLYDVVFHPDALRLAAARTRFRELVNTTALDALRDAYNLELDRNNVRFPRAAYKGAPASAVIRKPDPDFKPQDVDDTGLSPEMIEKLYPQTSYPKPQASEPGPDRSKKDTKCNKKYEKPQEESSYTIPKYEIRQQKSVDLQDFTYDPANKHNVVVPTRLVVEISLPLVSSTADCVLDVREKNLSLVCEKPARYKLDLMLPYSVNDELGDAKFDKTRRLLVITLPVSRKNFVVKNAEDVISLKLDSGLESEENSTLHSDEESFPKCSLVTELDPVITDEPAPAVIIEQKMENQNDFLESYLNYVLPSYTYNLLDDVIAFTFHVKNTEPDSVFVKTYEDNIIRIKFTSIGAGFVPVYYTAFLQFDDNIMLENVSGEAWNNNVILQIESSSCLPKKVLIGLDQSNLTCEQFDASQSSNHNVIKNSSKLNSNSAEEMPKPVIEVTNMMSETTVTVTSNDLGSESSSDNENLMNVHKIVWNETNSDGNAKGILRKPVHIPRSLSESSAYDVASSMDYISSDCIPEESSLKKTVRFSDVIARQFYRYNSSIEGQKKKNQRKKSKKKGHERRKSESEAEDDVFNKKMVPPNTEKSEKLRRDSGLADTSDAETDESKPTEPSGNPVAVAVTCDTIQHNTDMYNPDKLNKGLYQEVNFKNDLIFDLDM